MKNNFSHEKTKGFSLIEVLLAAAIMSFGLLALASLQTSIMRSSSDSKAQSVALSLAKDKLEDLRSYQNMAGYRAITDKTAPTCPDVDCISLGGVNYIRSWQVVRYAFPSPYTSASQFTEQNDTAVLGPAFAESNEFKRVAVSVTWTDATGATGPEQTITIEDVISALSPTDSANLTSIKKNVRPRGPEVVIKDPSLTAGVIPIAIGNGSDTAATNPRPEVIGQGNNSTVVETRFDVLTYAALAGDNALAQQRVETTVVGCSCSASAGSVVGFRPTYWDGLRYTAPVAATYTTVGVAQNVTQSARCTACCRDHRDPTGVAGAKFDPRRTDTHKHFNTSLAPADFVTTGAYREACRLVRVDGFFRTAADLNNDYFGALFTGNNSVSVSPSTATATNYQNFVVGYLKARYVTPTNGTYTPSTYPGNTPASFSSTITSLETSNSLNTPSPTPINADTDPKWTHSRGVYIDHLEQEAITAIKAAKDDTACNTARPDDPLVTGDQSATAAEVLAACVLKLLPFTSINLTEIANWRSTNAPQTTPATTPPTYIDGTTDDTTTIQVSNNAFVTSIAATDPVRGQVIMGSNPPANGTSNARTEITASNAGVALFNPIDGDTDSTILSDFQTFINGSAPPEPGGGTFRVTMSGELLPMVPSNPPRVEFTISNISVNCNTTATTVLPFVCTTTSGQKLGVNLTPTAPTLPWTNTTRLVVASYNRQDDKVVANPCKNNATIAMPYRTVYDVSAATSNNATFPPTISALQENNNNGVGLPAAGGESTSFDVTSVYDGDTINVSFINKAYRCPQSNTCGGPGNNTPLWSSTYVACPNGFTP